MLRLEYLFIKIFCRAKKPFCNNVVFCASFHDVAGTFVLSHGFTCNIFSKYIHCLFLGLNIKKIITLQMSNLKSGRPNKKINSSAASIEFELHPFANTLQRIGGNACKWSLNKEWLVFYKIYFNTSYAKCKHARASYGFFKKH